MMWNGLPSGRLLVGFAILFSVATSARAAEPAGAKPGAVAKAAAPRERDTLWIVPHTHWEGAVFKTREEYLEIGLPHILHALELLKKYPDYTFTLDQVAYVRPFLERYPEHVAEFQKYVNEGRLNLVLGMDVMPDVNKPGAESLVRQIQCGKGYYRRKLGVDVTTGWLVDSFGFHAQMPQILKLAGYKSFWFSRGEPSRDFPSEFLWQGLDGTRIPAVWLPHAYVLFADAPTNLPDFENFASKKFDLLTPYSRGRDRVACSGWDVSDPEDALPRMMDEHARSHHDLGFDLRFGTPTQFDELVAKRPHPFVFKGELNPVFQGTYTSRIELKQAVREMERLLTLAEKLGVLSQWLGGTVDEATLAKAWELVVFNETHDLASGVMTDHVYDDVRRELGIAHWLADRLIDENWNQFEKSIDTRGEGTPIVVFNPLGWKRSEVVEVRHCITDPNTDKVVVFDPKGREVPSDVEDPGDWNEPVKRDRKIAFFAHDIPAMGFAVYRAKGIVATRPAVDATVEPAGIVGIENQFYDITFDQSTGAITKLHVKEGNWDAIRGPANVVSRQEDKGDLWELYRDLSAGGNVAMTTKQAVPRPSETTKLSSEFRGRAGEVKRGVTFSEFTVSHPFDNGKFSTTVRLTGGSPVIDITTRLVNNSKLVRYQALFPTTIEKGKLFQAIPFGASERPVGTEFPAQDWVDWGDGEHGVALLNVGLPGNLVSDGTLMLSLLRANTIAHYGFTGGYERGSSSDTGYELGEERTLHYALLPHRGDWRQAEVYRQAMELNHPLICRKAAPHDGALGTHWGWLELSKPNVVVSSLQSGRDGAALLRVFETTGRETKGIQLKLAARIARASETNLLDDPGEPLKTDGNTLTFDLSPFQIKTLRLQLDRPAAAAVEAPAK